MRGVLGCTIPLLLLVIGQSTPLQSATIRPAKPTHYFYTPTPHVNPPWHFVASLHEISYAFPHNLQLQLSLLDAIGRMKFGAKFGIAPNLSIGAGLSSYWGHMWYWDHRWHHPHWDPYDPYDRYYHYRYRHHYWPARLGVFLSTGRGRSDFEWSITPNLQLGDPIGLGCDFGLMATPSEWWSLIGEVGGSIEIDFHHHPWVWFFVDGGIRVHPPTIPFLSFDGGVGFGVFDWDPGVSIYIDVIFAMVTR
jgi:hypothetical protein